MRPDVIRYILQYRSTYTREAITRQLLAAGHEAAAIEATWQAIEQGELPPPPPGEPPYDLGTAAPSQPVEAAQPVELVEPTAPAQAVVSTASDPPAQPVEASVPVVPIQPAEPTVPAPTPIGGPIAPRPLVPPRPPGSSSLRSGLFWAVLISYVIGVYLLSTLAVAASAFTNDPEGFGGVVVFSLLWLGGLIGGLVLRGRNRPLGSGLLAGAIAIVVLPVAIGFIGLVIIAGICLVALSSSN